MSAAFYFGERFSERRTLRDDALLVRIGRFRIVELLGAYGDASVYCTVCSRVVTQ
jgi:hypothetical protein